MSIGVYSEKIYEDKVCTKDCDRCYGCYVKSCAIRENGVVQHAFILCRRKSDGAIGYYDVKNGVFYAKDRNKNCKYYKERE